MSLHAPDYNKSEYNNRIPSHLLFQQRCRSRYSRATPSTSTSSTCSQQQPHFYTSTTSSDSLSSLIKLIKHHHYLQLAKGQLAVPSSRSCRSISATSTSRRRLKQSHNFASARPSPERFIDIDISDMSSSGKRPSTRQPTVKFRMNTRRRSSQSSSQATNSSDDNSASPLATQDSTPPTTENSSPRAATPEQTETATLKTTPPNMPATKNLGSRPNIGSPAELATPEATRVTSPLGSSPLSSPPSSLGATPEGLGESTTRTKRKATSPSPTGRTRAKRNFTTLSGVPYGSLSPEQQPEHKSKAGGDDDDVGENGILAACASKRVKESGPKKREPNPSLVNVDAAPNKGQRKVRFTDFPSPGNDKSALTLLADTALADVQNPVDTETTSELLSSSQESNETAVALKRKPGRKPRAKKTYRNQAALDVDVSRHEEWVQATVFAHEDPKNPVFYAADGITQHMESAESTPTKNGKGGANTGGGVKKRKGGGGWNKGMGKGKGKGKGKARGKGNRRDDEEEDPFEAKDSTSDDTKATIKILKARQGVLRNFFREVGRQQADILDTLSLRDLNKLLRRSNAHKKVPEYGDVVEHLEEKKQDAIDFARRRYELNVKLAKDQNAKDEDLLEQQFKENCEQIRTEHLSGAQGDLMLLQKQGAAIIDDDRTDDGWLNQDSAYFPRYHEFTESSVRNEPMHVRGYESSKITDERPFKHQLAASNYDDQVRRDVLQDDVMAPIVQNLEKSNKERREAEAREKTQNMRALSNEAIHQLELEQLSEIKGYLVPTRLTSTELNSYSLSLLADISEYHADKFKGKTYRYIPLPPGETFPREALNYEQLPGTGGPPRRSHAPLPNFTDARNHNQNQRTHQFVFQNPGASANANGSTRAPLSAPAKTTAQSPPAVPTPRIQQRFPVQFVNQTIESRRSAGNQPKGAQRMLLPKV